MTRLETAQKFYYEKLSKLKPTKDNTITDLWTILLIEVFEVYLEHNPTTDEAKWFNSETDKLVKGDYNGIC